jgi:hypothetical protein
MASDVVFWGLCLAAFLSLAGIAQAYDPLEPIGAENVTNTVLNAAGEGLDPGLVSTSSLIVIAIAGAIVFLVAAVIGVLIYGGVWRPLRGGRLQL